MPSYFFDSSALVKRYHVEDGSAWVRSICDPRAHSPLYLAELAHVEVIAALYRAGQREHLHPSFVASMVNTFERHLTLSNPARPAPVYRLIPVSSVIFALAARLCGRYQDARPHPLRSLDAIQLVAGLLAATALSDELVFVTSDVRLTAIAALEGFRVMDPRYPLRP